MAPILLKIKGDESFSQLAYLDNEEELSKTWRICTKVKDSLENGSRLENLSWRLWHLHKITLANRQETERKIDLKKISTLTTQRLALDGGYAEQAKQEETPEQKKAPPNVEVEQQQSLPREIHPSAQSLPQQQQPISLAVSVEQVDIFEENYLQHYDDLFASIPGVAFLGGESMPMLEIPLESANELGFYASAQMFSNSETHVQQLPQQPWYELPEQSVLALQTQLHPPQAIFHAPPSEEDIGRKRKLSESRKSDPEIYNSNEQQQQVCANCHVTSTPLWRRCDNDRVLCNACGLYWKMHKADRPKNMKGSVKKMEEPRPVCANCHATNTPLWRRDQSGIVLCNACGLYRKMHNEDRPMHLKSDVIKKRQRAEKVPKKHRLDQLKAQFDFEDTEP